MGIHNLLQLLKSIQQEKHLSAFSNKTVGIDAYAWLHRSIYCCPIELAQGQKTFKHIQYCIKKIKQLLQNNIKPVMVFDGGLLPQKLLKENERQQHREDCKLLAEKFQKEGNAEQARKKYAESVDITPNIALELFNTLTTQFKIDCIISPYEADAQLAYLSKIGYIDFVISEDSDLLVYGTKTVFYKLDANGNGKVINYEDIWTIENFNLRFWDENMFLTACILSGCDYLDSLNKIGEKTAFKLVQDYQTITKILNKLRQDHKHQIPPNYETEFQKAFITFKFQRVYCPIKQMLVTLNEIDLIQLKKKFQEVGSIEKIIDSFDKQIIDPYILNGLLALDNLEFIGKDLEQDMACQVAQGKLNPQTLQPYKNILFSESLFNMQKFPKNKTKGLTQSTLFGEKIKPNQPKVYQIARFKEYNDNQQKKLVQSQIVQKKNQKLRVNNDLNLCKVSSKLFKPFNIPQTQNQKEQISKEEEEEKKVEQKKQISKEEEKVEQKNEVKFTKQQHYQEAEKVLTKRKWAQENSTFQSSNLYENQFSQFGYLQQNIFQYNVELINLKKVKLALAQPSVKTIKLETIKGDFFGKCQPILDKIFTCQEKGK